MIVSVFCRNPLISSKINVRWPWRVAQKLMRHSTLELTGRYTRPRMHDVEGAIGALPSLRPAPPAREAGSATGTDGPISNLLAPHLPHAGDGSGRDLSVAGVKEDSSPPMSMDRKSLEMEDFGGDCRPLAGTDASSGGGTRTPDTRIMIPLAENHKEGRGKKLRHITPTDALPLPLYVSYAGGHGVAGRPQPRPSEAVT